MPEVTVKVTVPRRGRAGKNGQITQTRTYWLNHYDLERSTATSYEELAMRKAKKQLTGSATYEVHTKGQG